MDVSLINPYLQGTLDVLRKMAFIEVCGGKPYLKQDNLARGDVSGVIGVTGDAVGSLAVSFSEPCICGIVGNMLGESFERAGREIYDAVGELTNMISGVARTHLEKQGLRVFAAIPAVIYGRNHSIDHILRTPSIVIPFQSEKGPFVVDVCIKVARENEGIPARGFSGVAAHASRESGTPSTAARQPSGETSQGMAPLVPLSRDGEAAASVAPVPEEQSKLARLRGLLKESMAKREAIQKLLSEKPFMEIQLRQRLRKELPLIDQRIRRLKMDIQALEIIHSMAPDELESPTIRPHCQSHPQRPPGRK